MTGTRVLHIGIAPRAFLRKRTIAIARGELRPAPDEPRVWFSSIESVAKVLSERNMLLLDMIRRSQPKSLAELARLSGRKVSNLSRTLHNMKRIGLVELEEVNHRKVPHVRYEHVTFDIPIGTDETPAHAA